MEIEPARRLASINVRELAEFRQNRLQIPKLGGPSRWRATVGQQWHEHLRKQAESSNGVTHFEKTLKGVWIDEGWTLTLRGKVDQWLEDDGHTTIREIKTISRLLPMEEEELLEYYPNYFAQLQTYLALALHQDESKLDKLSGELVFVSINEGLVQTVTNTSEDLRLYHLQRQRLRNYLVERRTDFDRLQSLRFKRPFTNWRPGQKTALKQLHDGHDRTSKGKPILFEAPTGFGKTGVSLQFALEKIKDGTYEKLFCLTGKSTGQNAFLKQLSLMQANCSPRYFQLRSREEHNIRSQTHTCDGRNCRKDLEEKWANSALDGAILFSKGTPTLEQIRKLGSETGICPYEISRSLVSRADVIVGDFNYVFSRRHNSFLLEHVGLPPHRILLLVDEAHNLPERVRESLSGDTNHHLAQILLAGVETCNACAAVKILAKNWYDLVNAIEPCSELPLDQLYYAEDILGELTEEILNSPFDWENFPKEAQEVINELLHLKNLLNTENLPLLAWSDQPGKLRLSCLDPSQEISATLANFGTSLLMSATLSPLDNFASNCGLEASAYLEKVTASASWRDNAYNIAIDHRIDTRLKLREKYYETTASTIKQFAESSGQPIAVYFPSYKYAGDVHELLKQNVPEFKTAIQPRRLTLVEQNKFIEEALENSKILLLMMGGSFAEGIDVLGGRIQRAIIVGPALPVADTVQRARMDRLEDLNPASAYDQICRKPAIIRIQQAVGRMVRAPGQHATILFHCQRFSEKEYSTLFCPEETYQIHSEEDLHSWISSSQHGS